jgi:sugar/nucleoside kinase (ribokinase family)
MKPDPELTAPEGSPDTPAADVVGMGTVTMHYEALVPELGSDKRKIHSQGLEVAPGGATAVALIQLARLGVSSAWLGILGDDDEGGALLNHFQNENVEIRCVEQREGKRTAYSWGLVTPEGDRTMFLFPNVLSDLMPEEVSARMIGCIDSSLHFHTDVATIPIKTTLQAIEVAHAADCMVFTDVDAEPVYLVEEVGLGRRKELESILQQTDVIKFCRSAAARLSESDNYEEACHILHERYGSRYTVVTAGKEGSYLAYNGEFWHIPALGGHKVDPTAAGGAYFGGLSYALLHGMNGLDAGYFAAACAAFACTRVGSLSLGTREEVDSVLTGEQVEEEIGAEGSEPA